MKRYYYDCPRGFSNEFIIISVEQTNKKEVSDFAEYMLKYNMSQNTDWDLHRVTAKRAREIISNERATKRAYERAGLNLCCNPVGATEITTATEFFNERG